MRDATYQPLEPLVVDRLTTAEGEFILYYVPFDGVVPQGLAAATPADPSKRSENSRRDESKDADAPASHD